MWTLIRRCVKHATLDLGPYWSCNLVCWFLAAKGLIFLFWLSIFLPHREKMGLQTYANSKASGEPVRPRSLARSFTVCWKFHQGLLFIKSKQQSFWRDCADVQARLKRCCLHMSEGPFSHDAAHLVHDNSKGTHSFQTHLNVCCADIVTDSNKDNYAC